MAVAPYLKASDDEDEHPIAERLYKARYSVEKSLAHAERYFLLKEQRDAAIKRFRKALEVLQTITEQ